jgi:hypothetical protein
LYSWKFQLQKTRTHYQDQLRLTSHVYPIVRKNLEEEGKKNKRGKPAAESSGMTNLLLIINNWNFVRDTQLQAMVKKCTPADFQVQLKLTSTAFRNASNPDCEFPFDKQAANFPYESFLQLHQSSGLKRFIRELKETYEDVEGISLEGDEEEEGEEAEEEEVVAKLLSKRNTLSELESEAEASLSGEEVEAVSVLPAGPSRKRGLKRCQSTSKRHLPAF